MSQRKPGYDEGIGALRESLDEPVDGQLLDDVQRRVQRAIAAERPSRAMSRPLVFGFAAAMAVIIAGVVMVALRRAPVVTTPVATRGSLQLELDGKPADASILGRTLAVRDGGRAVVTLEGEARLEVTGPARLTSRSGHVVLDSGSADVSVVKQAPGHRVVLGLGDATITVHGTRFIMVADDGRGVDVAVSEGVVEVSLGDVPSTFLHAGDSWHRPAAPAPPETKPTPEPAASGTPRPPLVAQSKKPKVDLRAAAEKAMARRDCEETRVLIGRYLTEVTDVAEAARTSMLEAECWLRAGDKARALPVLDRIAKDYAGQPGAQSALFEAAAARADLKQSAEAVGGFDAYLQRYPKGPFAETAAFRRCELINQLNGHTDGVACLNQFVTRFPNGRRTGDALLFAGSIACADDRYGDASKAYWSYLELVKPERDDVPNLDSLVKCVERGHAADAGKARDAFTKRHP